MSNDKQTDLKFVSVERSEFNLSKDLQYHYELQASRHPGLLEFEEAIPNHTKLGEHCFNAAVWLADESFVLKSTYVLGEDIDLGMKLWYSISIPLLGRWRVYRNLHVYGVSEEAAKKSVRYLLSLNNNGVRRIEIIGSDKGTCPLDRIELQRWFETNDINLTFDTMHFSAQQSQALAKSKSLHLTKVTFEDEGVSFAREFESNPMCLRQCTWENRSHFPHLS